MNYKSFNLGDWIGHINGVIEDERKLDGNEMRDLVEFLSRQNQEPILGKIRAEIIELRSRQNVGVLECLDIIDKYKAESEVDNGNDD